MKRTCSGCRNERKVNICARHTGKLDLSLLCSFLKSLHYHLIVTKINAVFSLKSVCHPINNSLVKIVTAKSVVSCGCKNLKNSVGDFKQRNVERTAAEVEHHYFLVCFFIHTVCKSCRGGLVDYTKNLKTCDLTCILCCLSLSVGKVSGNGYNSLSYRRAEISFSVCLKLLKYHCGYLLRCVRLSVYSSLVRRTHLTLDTDHSSIGIGNRLTLCNLTYHSFTRL